MKANEVKKQPEKVTPQPCIICGKLVTQFYGTWGNSGTCSRKCEQQQEKDSTYFFDGR